MLRAPTAEGLVRVGGPAPDPSAKAHTAVLRLYERTLATARAARTVAWLGSRPAACRAAAVPRRAAARPRSCRAGQLPRHDIAQAPALGRGFRPEL